jgi:hypothetical protein
MLKEKGLGEGIHAAVRAGSPEMIGYVGACAGRAASGFLLQTRRWAPDLIGMRTRSGTPNPARVISSGQLGPLYATANLP